VFFSFLACASTSVAEAPIPWWHLEPTALTLKTHRRRQNLTAFLCKFTPGALTLAFLRGYDVSAGATAWDEEDGDVSKHILSCPPISCMPFNCPGHESFRKGLSGCGIDTVSAPVDTVFSLVFTTSDLNFPPATSEVVRLITVVSPCGQGQMYCPGLAKPAHATGELACGTTDCISRAAIIALQPIEPTLAAPSIAFSTALPVSAISNTTYDFLSVYVHGHRDTIIPQVRCLY
jgi:hypothetical protein